MSRNSRILFALLTVFADALMASLALYVAYELRGADTVPHTLETGTLYETTSPLPRCRSPHYWSRSSSFRLYHLRRGRSRIDLLYAILSAVSISSLASTALAYLVYLP